MLKRALEAQGAGIVLSVAGALILVHAENLDFHKCARGSTRHCTHLRRDLAVAPRLWGIVPRTAGGSTFARSSLVVHAPRRHLRVAKCRFACSILMGYPIKLA